MQLVNGSSRDKQTKRKVMLEEMRIADCGLQREGRDEGATRNPGSAQMKFLSRRKQRIRMSSHHHSIKQSIWEVFWMKNRSYSLTRRVHFDIEALIRL
jgi:hypothetical protein